VKYHSGLSIKKRESSHAPYTTSPFELQKYTRPTCVLSRDQSSVELRIDSHDRSKAQGNGRSNRRWLEDGVPAAMTIGDTRVISVCSAHITPVIQRPGIRWSYESHLDRKFCSSCRHSLWLIFKPLATTSVLGIFRATLHFVGHLYPTCRNYLRRFRVVCDGNSTYDCEHLLGRPDLGNVSGPAWPGAHMIYRLLRKSGVCYKPVVMILNRH
jgi:hypothetical protein